jgi:putative ABC transport system permease protein
MREILYIYRARLRARTVLVQELLAVAGIAVGVALLFASSVASTSLSSSVRRLNAGVTGNATLQVAARAPDGFSGRLLGEVRRLPGVRRAEPVLEQRAVVIGPSGRRSVELISSDPRYVRLGADILRKISLRRLAGARIVALPAPVGEAIGVDSLQTAELEIRARRFPVLVGARLDEAEIGELIDSPLAIAPLEYAQSITGLRGRLTRILVFTAPGATAAVARELAGPASAVGASVEPADHDASLFETAAAPAGQSEDLFSAISALVGFLFAFNAILVTVQLRRGLVETLRTRGATRAMTVQVLLFDAAVLGVAGSLLGLAFGEVLSLLFFRADPGYLSFAFAVGSPRIVTVRTVLLAAATGPAVAGVGVLAPLHDVLRLRLRAAPSERPARAFAGAPPRAALGVGCLVLTTVILFLRPASAVLGCVALAAALLILLPFCFDAVLALFDRVQRPLYAASTRIALVELRNPATRTRSLAIAATGAIALFGSVSIEGAKTNLERGLDASVKDIGSNAAVWVAPQGEGNAFETIPFEGPPAGALARLPGIASVRAYRGGFLDWGNRRVWVLAPPKAAPLPVPPSQILKGNVAAATAALRGGALAARRGGSAGSDGSEEPPAAVVSDALAAAHGLRIGARFLLPSPRPTLFRVAALATNLGWPPGAIVVDADAFARGWGSADASAWQVAVAPGVSPAAVREEIRRALGPHTALVVQTETEWVGYHYATTREALSRLSQIGELVLLASVLAMAGAMGSMIWQRRPQMAYIKRQGYKRGVLWRALLCESALLLGAGCLIGALFGVYGRVLLSHALASVTGFPVVFSVGGLSALESFAVVSAAATAILSLPGYLAVRVPPTTVSAA